MFCFLFPAFLWLSAAPSCISPVSMYPYLHCVYSLLLSLLVHLFIFPEHVSVSVYLPMVCFWILFPMFFLVLLELHFGCTCLAFVFWISQILLFTLCFCLSFGFHRLWIFQLYVIKFAFCSLPACMCVLCLGHFLFNPATHSKNIITESILRYSVKISVLPSPNGCECF